MSRVRTDREAWTIFALAYPAASVVSAFALLFHPGFHWGFSRVAAAAPASPYAAGWAGRLHLAATTIPASIVILGFVSILPASLLYYALHRARPAPWGRAGAIFVGALAGAGASLFPYLATRALPTFESLHPVWGGFADYLVRYPPAGALGGAAGMAAAYWARSRGREALVFGAAVAAVALPILAKPPLFLYQRAHVAADAPRP